MHKARKSRNVINEFDGEKHFLGNKFETLIRNKFETIFGEQFKTLLRE